MSLVELRPDDLVELASGGPLMRLIGRNGVAMALDGRVWKPRSLWLCRWWDTRRAGQPEAWFPVETLRLVKRL